MQAALIDVGFHWRQGTKRQARYRRMRPGAKWHLESLDAWGLARCCDAVLLGEERRSAVRPERACLHCLHRAGRRKIGDRYPW